MKESDEESLRKKMLLRLKNLNTFIRNIEDYSVQYQLEVSQDKVYIAACSQRSLLRELLDIK
jgi:hypothetical protein